MYKSKSYKTCGEKKMLKVKMEIWRSYGGQSGSLVIGSSMFPEKKHFSKYWLNLSLQSQINRICNEKHFG